jgi:prepilin-type N-terminal cleavage/methylation domain-containing protein
MRRPTSDDGFSLVELLIVIVVLGFLTTIVVFSVRGITDKGETSACTEEARILATAVESYFAQEQIQVLPANGAADGQEYERSLVQAGFLRSPSDYFDLDQTGGMVADSNGPC